MHFEAAAALNRWSERDKCLTLITAMKGGAQKVVQHLSAAKRSTYNSLVRVLNKRNASE